MKFNATYEDLKEKIVVVFGSNGLLGIECVKGFINQKSTVIGVDIMAPVIESCPNYHHNVCDITDKEKAASEISSIISTHGHIDVMVNTSYPRTKDWGRGFLDEDVDYFIENIGLQLGTAYHLSKLCLDHMVTRKEGVILNYGSVYGLYANNASVYKDTPMSIGITYNSIKGATANMTKAMAAYYGEFNIRVNSVCPGGVFDHQNNTFVDKFSNLNPLGRMGSPKEMAEATVFMCSDSASYITGQNMLVDGGWSIW